VKGGGWRGNRAGGGLSLQQTLPLLHPVTPVATKVWGNVSK